MEASHRRPPGLDGRAWWRRDGDVRGPGRDRHDLRGQRTATAATQRRAGRRRHSSSSATTTGSRSPPPPPIDGDRDHDGVPEPDPDGDGIVGANDKCPTQAEDFDHFQDEDGCPDPDNDHDGFLDTVDKCPNDPETFNGFEDEDGCPDQIPAAVVAAFDAATATRFDPGRARLTAAGKLALDKAIVVLRVHPTMHVRITGHPANGDPDDLAKKRADVVKWYLVEQGIPADQLETVVGGEVKPKGAPIELSAAPKP